MTRSLPLVLVAEPLTPEAISRLDAVARVVHAGPDLDALRPHLSAAEGLIVRTHTRVHHALLDAAPQLRVVGRAGVGLDTIDILECQRRDVAVVHTPDANTTAVVEYVLSAVLARRRPIHAVPAGLDLAGWRAARQSALVPREVGEETIGVLGLGRIGRRIARAFTALGSRVLYHDVINVPADAREGAEPVDLDELRSRSTILTVHVDGRPSNRRLIDAAWLAELRDDVLLVNAARGFIVDDAALAAFLNARTNASAIIDVHEPEPIPTGAPLASVPNALLTAHAASRTGAAQRAMSDVVDDVIRVLNGAAPVHPAAIPGSRPGSGGGSSSEANSGPCPRPGPGSDPDPDPDPDPGARGESI
ncbi:MAG: NAD(P)-dependent oxidoreductase [Phycisphaerales bacterium]